VARRAEAEDEGEGPSILGIVAAADEEEKQEEAEIEKQNRELEAEFNMTLTEDSLGDTAMKEETAEEAARRGARQITYTLKPSMRYVTYIAKQNAIRRWTSDGPDGRNSGCAEVQIALLTERIRNMVIHMRDMPKDFHCRLKLQILVGRRRKMMDKLAWRNLPAYLKVRDELKIRHTYRMEALIGRLGSYVYTFRNKPRAPGKKTAMRMKKQAKLLSGRLARKLRQGKSKNEIRMLKFQMRKRRFTPRSHEETASLLAGNEVKKFVDPLNQPRL